jgi:hypothetical protein
MSTITVNKILTYNLSIYLSTNWLISVGKYIPWSLVAERLAHHVH